MSYFNFNCFINSSDLPADAFILSASEVKDIIIFISPSLIPLLTLFKILIESFKELTTASRCSAHSAGTLILDISFATVCVAAHECGHAVQDKVSYRPLVLRSSLVPAAQIGSNLSWPIFIAGLIFSLRPLMGIGIILFSLAVLFQLITLPVEFDASSRALKILGTERVLTEEELRGGRKVLNAAAMTYVAALAASALQLLRLIILARGRNRD